MLKAKFQRFTAGVFALATALVPFVGAKAASVAIIQGSFYTPDLANQLTAQGNTVTLLSSYSAASLSPYDAVVQYGNSFVDQAALTLYVSAGGTLVWTPWAGLNFSVQPQLQVFTNGGSANYNVASPGMTVLSPGNPLLSGVSFPAAGTTNVGYIGGIGFAAGVDQIANWSNGTALLGETSLGSGHIIGINLHVITSDTAYTVINQAWASNLLDNAVNAGVSPVPGPVVGAGLPGVLAAFGGLLAWRRRRNQTAVT
jgi:hypothetical protein